LAGKSAVPYGEGWASIDYDAAPGETNRVVLSQVDDLTIRVADSGARITPGRACRSVDAHTAQCSVAGRGNWNGLIGANVRAGDMDDVVDSQGPGLSADGGPGNDTLQSSSLAAGTLDGGGGRDTLLGGTNRDTLIDGDTSGAADSDVLDGREGGAIVSYASRTKPVKVDLAHPGRDGELGERDVIRSVVGITGGHGADVLRGDGDLNVLEGGAGSDRLYGLGNDDFLDGGRGADRLVGQAGDDSIDGGAGRDLASGGAGRDYLDGGAGADRLRGGSGPDLLRSGAAFCGSDVDEVSPSAMDYIDRDCEAAQFALRMTQGEGADAKGISVKPHPYRWGRSSVTFRVQCPYTETDGYPNPLELRGVLRISASDGALLGSGRIPEAGRRCAANNSYEGASELPWVPIRASLTPVGRHLSSLRRAPRVTVDFSGRNVPPVPWTIRWRTR
jgi:hypothetical protein